MLLDHLRAINDLSNHEYMYQVIIIIGPPPAVAYPFILDVEGYPGQVINLFIVLVSAFKNDVVNKQLISR